MVNIISVFKMIASVSSMLVLSNALITYYRYKPSFEISSYDQMVDQLNLFMFKFTNQAFLQSSNCDYECANNCISSGKFNNSKENFAQCVSEKCKCYFMENSGVMTGIISSLAWTVFALISAYYSSFGKKTLSSKANSKIAEAEGESDFSLTARLIE